MLRRYTDVALLQGCLQVVYPGALVPPMPERNMMVFISAADHTLINTRTKGINRFIKILVSDPQLYANPFLRAFLTDSNDKWEKFKEEMT